ncbi:isoprenylcysteine carboxylmethyltransferase family protein [Mesorhizobium sp. Z1-4]|uniref:methyltransferase family protein n=1 Tax=Mesorhizobium sp. Z1-4 TaxID=2448478 RepID=UPI000FDA9C57|nr:isoprenylcysteine carboxylmethyltransferase family protein [Mesorhizobium sp. Z1-4]
MSEHSAPPSRLPWPPMIYVAAVALAIVAQWLWPLPWIGPPLADLLFALGWLMVLAALALDFGAMRTMRKARTTILPHRAADHLVTGGPFALSRNPIYLGNTTLMVAIGFIAGSLWFLLLAPLAAIATTFLAIRQEERHLAERFGKRYRDYQKKVRRWL